MATNTIKYTLDFAIRRIEVLSQHTDRLLLSPEVLSILLEELHVALEELEVQYNEITSTRQQLEDERSYYRNLFELAPESYLITNLQGVIERANPAAANMINVPQEFLIGKPLVLFVAEAQRKSFTSELDQVPIINGKLLLKPRDQEPFLAIINVFPIQDQKGQVIGLRWLLRPSA